MTLVEEYRNIAKLAQDKENAEVVIDAILTHFDVDYDDMDLGIEWLYTTGVIGIEYYLLIHGLLSKIVLGQNAYYRQIKMELGSIWLFSFTVHKNGR